MQYLYLLQYERRFEDRVLDSGSKAGFMTLFNAADFEGEVEEMKQRLKSGPYDSQLKIVILNLDLWPFGEGDRA